MTFTTRALAALASGVVALASGLSAPVSALAAQARTAPPSKDSAQIVYDDEGLRIHSADGKKQLKVRAYFVAEYHASLGDTSDAISNALMMKRSRLILDAHLNPRILARVMFDAGPPSGTSPLQDAYAEVGLWGSWWVRAGKQKTPVGLERYMSISAQLLPDRSIASGLNGSRDVGILLTGDLTKQLELSLGVFNGVPDGSGTQDSDPNDDKDLTYRLWWKPLRTKVNGVEQGFGLAYNGSTGMEKSPSTAGARLPALKTIAGSTWFSYLESGGVRAYGRHTRNGVFSYFHRGPFGAFAEWASNSQDVLRAPTPATIGTSGWVANAQWNITGELSAQEGVLPATAFDPDNGKWGAWQVGVRAAQVKVGDEAFPTFSNPAVAARGALEIGAGVNWYITRQTKMQLAYEHITFDGGAVSGNRKPERYVQVRWQAYF
jgi:phosphate-selective porin OprO/OprP